MSPARRPFTVLVSAMLVAVALAAAPPAPDAQGAMGAAARDWERRTAQAQRSQRARAEQRARMDRSRVHGQMPDTMYASTPDLSPPPHPFTLDVTLKSVPERSGAKVSARSAARVGHRIALFPAASHWARENGYQGFARVFNRSDAAGEVHIDAFDDAGVVRGPVTLSIGAGETAHFNSEDLETGNADKGLARGVGSGRGDWRLELSSALDIEVLAYIRTKDGFLTSMHDVVQRTESGHRVATFNPGRNVNQVSRLRLVNPGSKPARVTIEGMDDTGDPSGQAVKVSVTAGASRTLSSQELESGDARGLSGALGTGTGKWQLVVTASQPIEAMSLLASSETGHLTNLSTVPARTESEAGDSAVHRMALFPAAARRTQEGYQGFVRIINRSDAAGEVRIEAFDDAGVESGPVTLAIGANETKHFNSDDLERGNADKGLSKGIGPGTEGDWRLELTSALDIETLAYIRTDDGFLTAMHDVAPSGATTHRVVVFNPGSNTNQASRLRVVNPGAKAATVRIEGVDDAGASGNAVAFTLGAGAARTLSSGQLEEGGAGVRGALGDGEGKWRLAVTSGQPIEVMSLLSSPEGYLTNLSTVRGGVVREAEETAAEVFAERISGPIVQGKCIDCHVEGGLAGATPLLFAPATRSEHVTLNFRTFEEYIAQVDDGANVILNKIQGVGHGGGEQVRAGTPGFADMQRFLGLLGEDVASVPLTPKTLFDTVTMAPARKVLRRAALIVAGRMPTDEEYAAAGSWAGVRETIRGLMTGPEFHEFLIRAANDRLLTDRRGTIIDHHADFLVEFSNEAYRRAAEGRARDDERYFFDWNDRVQHGARRAPLELIAHVVENDLPYTEVLTADYVMANPMAAEAYDAPTRFDDPDDPHEFKPSRIVSYYRHGDGFESEYDPVIGATRVLERGPLKTEFPHAGILNTSAFLIRYPTTATNRNRARSRWTYYHFLGLDIEKSASRTTDPVALADTNNPTLRNPACTVCHRVLDPVAGAFQNYGDDGWYKDKWGGVDSLDDFYKYDPSGGEDFRVSARSREQGVANLGNRRLFAGQRNELGLKNLRTFDGDTKLHIGLGEVVVRGGDGRVVHRFETKDAVADEDCGSSKDYGYKLWYCRELLVLPLKVPRDGTYRIGMEAWVLEPGTKATTLQVWMPGPFYREGDTWFRDMRVPGFDARLAPNPDNSVQWLAKQIVAEKRFAEATVEFWWPAIMGGEVAEPPEDEGDADFEGLLLAANAQGAEVARLANGFRRGFQGRAAYNLKDLLVEIVLSQWFRADVVEDGHPVRRVALRDAGARRLLTPEELARKTAAVTGVQWGREIAGSVYAHARRPSALTEDYRLLYGGIDSDGIIERARDVTSVMAGVARRHAAVVSCPVVMRDFYLLPDAERRLFAGIDQYLTPGRELSDVFEIEARSYARPETLSMSGPLSAGPKTVRLTFENDFWDPPDGDRNIRLDRLVLRDSSGRIVVRRELEDLEPAGDCNYPVGDHFALHCNGSVDVPLEVPAAGDFRIEIVAWADQGGDELPRLSVFVESETGGSGAEAVRAKVVELYGKLLGVQVTPHSPDVDAAYRLFVDVMARGRAADETSFRGSDCYWNWDDDFFFLEGILDDAVEWRENEHGGYYGFSDRANDFMDSVDWSDPHYAAQAWAVVLAYLLTDYRYLYL